MYRYDFLTFLSMDPILADREGRFIPITANKMGFTTIQLLLATSYIE